MFLLDPQVKEKNINTDIAQVKKHDKIFRKKKE